MSLIFDHAFSSQNGTYTIVGKIVNGRLVIYLDGIIDPIIFVEGEEVHFSAEGYGTHYFPIRVKVMRA